MSYAKQTTMRCGRYRLDRFISKATSTPLREVRHKIALNKVNVDGVTASSANLIVNQFSRVQFNNALLAHQNAAYWMMNKPKGVVSATKDSKHQTVMDLLEHREKNQLHIVGRLDFNSTGLLLLTNDGQWSRAISLPNSGLSKTYRVVVAKPISNDCVQAFAKGMYFETEAITTLPAQLIRHNDFEADVILSEGKYHQIKRMFGRFDNPVVELHRTAVGSVHLDETLGPGQARVLTESEIIKLSLYSDR